jgi:hypothetical protein
MLPELVHLNSILDQPKLRRQLNIWSTIGIAQHGYIGAGQVSDCHSDHGDVLHQKVFQCRAVHTCVCFTFSMFNHVKNIFRILSKCKEVLTSSAVRRIAESSVNTGHTTSACRHTTAPVTRELFKQLERLHLRGVSQCLRQVAFFCAR